MILFNVAGAETECKNLEKQTGEAGFYDDIDKAHGVLKQIKRLSGKCDAYAQLKRDWEDLNALVELAIECDDSGLIDEAEASFGHLSDRVDKMRLATLLSGPYDSNSCIITIHPGAGGTEAQDWAEMLFRMYTRWAERSGYGAETLDYLPGADGIGIKSVTIEVTGDMAYGYAKSEKGVHRLVRISPFDSSGRRHTSFAAVEVMPELDDEVEVNINPDDLRVDTYRASGAGGQHINKTASAIRITHLPTGVVVSCQSERSQKQNRDSAMKMIKAKLLEIAEREHEEKIENIKGIQKEIAWGSQIRSYVFHPYSMVKDHRTNFETGNVGAVMDGEIDGFINAFLNQQVKTGG